MDLSAKFPVSMLDGLAASSRGASEGFLPGVGFTHEELEDLSQLLYRLGLYATACEDDNAVALLRGLSDRVETHLHLVAPGDWTQFRLPLAEANTHKDL